ncbi:MAG TPA: NAD(P)H-quinone oxidoreductase [Mycobacteriales bacterium]|nr:NAD(P)H-quinone oxidoreductase [Mycobacteriales bacterium]
MHAITLPSHGGPEVLTWASVPEPLPGPGEVVVEVAAAGVNRADVLQRQGHYPPLPGVVPYPGLECSGTIAALGRGVEDWNVGTPVCALVAGGAYAERVAVPVGQLLPVPQGLALVDSAGLPEAACTVWSNVFELGRLQPGEVLLVHGGSSGIGTLAIQLGVRFGARVFATAGTPEKVERCRELGAEVVIQYRTEDFVDRIAEETGGHGADVILDIVGAAYLNQNVEALAEDGRLVVIGMQGGQTGEVNLARLLAKRGTITASGLRTRSLESKAAIVAAVREHVWPVIESGDVRPIIDRTMPIADAGKAHEVMEAGEHIGKIILTV